MASKKNTVYLGFLDDQVTTQNQHHLNFTTSKVGGHPVSISLYMLLKI